MTDRHTDWLEMK